MFKKSCFDSASINLLLLCDAVGPEPAILKRAQISRARQAHESGWTIKVIAVVTADGNVKKVDAVGGSPILVEAAESAISQWKYAPGAESREPVELRFNP